MLQYLLNMQNKWHEVCHGNHLTGLHEAASVQTPNYSPLQRAYNDYSRPKWSIYIPGKLHPQ